MHNDRWNKSISVAGGKPISAKNRRSESHFRWEWDSGSVAEHVEMLLYGKSTSHLITVFSQLVTQRDRQMLNAKIYRSYTENIGSSQSTYYGSQDSE